MKFSSLAFLLLLMVVTGCGKNHFLLSDDEAAFKNTNNLDLTTAGATSGVSGGIDSGSTGGSTDGGATNGATVGGATTGGATTGGATTGGATTGGATTGGATTGGAAAGGATAGGATAGGATTGGATAGGATTGGATTGGAAACVQELQIHEDHNNDGESDKYLGNITCFSGSIPAVENYNLTGESSEVIYGPKELPHQSRVFCYKDSMGINLMISHHKKNTGSHSGNTIIWDIETSKNNDADKVLLSDESNELALVASANMNKNYTGHWSHKKDTDGGIIGPFKSKDFKIIIDIKEIGNTTHTQFFSANNQHKSMKDCHKGNNKSFIILSKETCKNTK